MRGSHLNRIPSGDPELSWRQSVRGFRQAIVHSLGLEPKKHTITQLAMASRAAGGPSFSVALLISLSLSL